MIDLPEHIKSLQPYKPGKPISELMREQGLSRVVKLASNENPLGPSPKGIEAAHQCLDRVHRYVDPRSFELTSALAERFNIKPSQIICGAGTDSLLAYVIAAFTRVGDEVLTADGTFIGIYVNVHKQNRQLKLVPLKDYSYDLDAILEAIESTTRVIYLANPNNPTGTYFSRDAFESFIERVPDRVLVILDEAYYTFGREHSDYPDGLRYLRPNMIVTRTFSKDYGLAGLRVGFAVGPEELISELYKVKLPFEPSYPAQMAAIAALEDVEFVEKSLIVNRESLKRMGDKFTELGIQFVPTGANFYLMVLDSEEQASALTSECMNRGLILRHVQPFGVPNGVRINSGTVEETEFALKVIEKVYTQLADTSSKTKISD